MLDYKVDAAGPKMIFLTPTRRLGARHNSQNCRTKKVHSPRRQGRFVRYIFLLIQTLQRPS